MTETNPAAKAIIETKGVPALSPAKKVDLDPQTWKQLWWLCQRLSSTGFFPKAINTPEKAFAIILAGRDFGFSPMMSIRSLRIIEGKITLAADVELGLMLSRGVRFDWIEKTNKRAAARVERAGQAPQEFEFTIEMADRALLVRNYEDGSPNNWIKYPEAMLRARVVTIVGRAYCPDICAGVFTREELDDDYRGDPPDFREVDSTGTLPEMVPAQLEAGPSPAPPPTVVDQPIEVPPDSHPLPDDGPPSDEPDPHTGLSVDDIVAAVGASTTRAEATEAAKRGNPAWKGTAAGDRIRAAYDAKIAHLAAIDAAAPKPTPPASKPAQDRRTAVQIAAAFEKEILAAKTSASVQEIRARMHASTLEQTTKEILADVCNQQLDRLRSDAEAPPAHPVGAEAEPPTELAATYISRWLAECDDSLASGDPRKAQAAQINAKRSLGAREITVTDYERVAHRAEKVIATCSKRAKG